MIEDLQREPTEPDLRIGLALSGGGHRASAWALGVLIHLVDVNATHSLRSIASVSGGSITNGFVAANYDLKKSERAAFAEKVAAPLARRIATDGTVFADRMARDVKRAIVGLTILTVILALAVVIVTLGNWYVALLGPEPFELRGPPSFSWLGSALMAALCTLLFLFTKRGDVFRGGYDRILFHQKLLGDAAREVEHVFCTTDMQFGEHVYLSARFVYAYRLGVSPPSGLLLADAVSASAAFPGAFPPHRIPTKSMAFKFGADTLPKQLVLLDGGIYDNMAEQWLTGITKRVSGKDLDANSHGRAQLLKSVTAMNTVPNELIVANASPAFPKEDIEAMTTLGLELAALFKFPLALHDNSSSLRRNYLVTQFIKTAATGKGLRGTLVHIGTNPAASAQVARAELNRGQPNASQKERVSSVERLLNSPLGEDNTAVDWTSITRRNCSIATVLDPIGERATAELMMHACVLTAVQRCLYLEQPLPPEVDWPCLFSWERFARLARGIC